MARRGLGGGHGAGGGGVFRPAAGWLKRLLGGSRRSYRHNMVHNPGPLASMPGNPAANFAGGRYNEITLPRDVTLHRGGQSGQPFGRWFTAEAPPSRAYVRVDSAVLPHWIDPKTGASSGSSPIDTGYAIRFPAGTKIYHGPVANQGGVYVGGGDQIYIPEPWKHGTVIGQRPLP
jgi:hypothetical protein